MGAPCALPLRETAHPVSYPRLTSLTEPRQVRLNSIKRSGIKSWQVLLEESVDRDQIEGRQREGVERCRRTNSILVAGRSERTFCLLDGLLNVPPRRQRTEVIHGVRAPSHGRDSAFLCPQFTVVRFDPCNKLLESPAQGHGLRTENQLVQVLSVVCLHR